MDPNYIANQPRDIQQQLLLYFDYPEILRLCSGFSSLNWICSSKAFWADKASSLGIDPKSFYETHRPPHERYLELLSYEDCEEGSEQFVSPEECSKRAGRKGNRRLIEYFHNLGIPYDFALEGAAFSHNLDLMEELLDQGANLRYALQGAARAGHLDIIKRYLPELNHSIIVNEVLQNAIQGDSLPILQYLNKNYTELNFRDAALDAALLN